ncbi:MAG: hypothetical protein PHQ54_05280, partial [Candidatus Omnitrophica bacterium]|nr:hypothetical protein [Candidatus Omnitrophota bacterium]
MYKKVNWIGLAVVFFLFNPVGTVSAEISGSQDVTLNYYSVSGNKSNSFYIDGDFDIIYEGNIDWKHLTDADEFFGSLYYRATDDKNTDPQEFSIEKFYLGLRNQDREYLLGDFYANFSDYSLGNALKGIKLDLGLQSEHRLIIVGGMDTSQWEDLWEKRCDDSRNRSYVWGVRLENSLLEKKLGLNLNYGGKLDDRAYFSSSNSPVFVNVLSLDTSYMVNDALKLSGEYAYSLTDEDIRDSSLKDKGDPAFNLGLEYNISRYSLTTDYSRIYSHFNSTGGFTSQDLEAFGLNGIWFMPFNIKCTHYLNADRDNLTKAQSTTTKQLNPGVKFGF